MGLKGSMEEQIFFRELQIEIGNGSTTQFCTDHWLGDAPLKVLFPSLYELPIQKHESVVTMGWHDAFTC